MLLLPTAVLLDAARGPVRGLAVVQGVLAVSFALLGAFAVSFAVVAVARRMASRPLLPNEIGLGPLRRAALCRMCPLWAAAGLWRFVGEPLEAVSSAAWGAFGIALVIYGAAVVGSAVRLVLDFGKVPS